MKIGAKLKLGKKSGVGAGIKLGKKSGVGAGIKLGKKKIGAGAEVDL
jgi:hypothetical protein